MIKDFSILVVHTNTNGSIATSIVCKGINSLNPFQFYDTSLKALIRGKDNSSACYFRTVVFFRMTSSQTAQAQAILCAKYSRKSLDKCIQIFVPKTRERKTS